MYVFETIGKIPRMQEKAMRDMEQWWDIIQKEKFGFAKIDADIWCHFLSTSASQLGWGNGLAAKESERSFSAYSPLSPPSQYKWRELF